MATKNVNTRIINKHDIEANWLKAKTPPYKGEIIIYDIEVDENGNTLELPEGRTTPYTYERFKIGDGKTLVKDLPFYGDGTYAPASHDHSGTYSEVGHDHDGKYITAAIKQNGNTTPVSIGGIVFEVSEDGATLNIVTTSATL